MPKENKTHYFETAKVSFEWSGSECQMINVIRTTLLRRGKGVEGDPIRIITQYWTLEGELLFEHDPCSGEATGK